MGPSVSRHSSWENKKTDWNLTLFLICKWKTHTSFQMIITVHVAVVQNSPLFASVFQRICRDFCFLHLGKGKHQIGWRVWVGDVRKEDYGGFN